MALTDRRVQEGDTLRLKKPHPCGTNAWRVMRLGVDVKLRCTGCGQIIRLPRRRFERRLRGFADGGEAEEQ